MDDLLCPRHPVIFSDNDCDVQSPAKCILYRFHYHSQKMLGSLGQCDEILCCLFGSLILSSKKPFQGGLLKILKRIVAGLVGLVP